MQFEAHDVEIFQSMRFLRKLVQEGALIRNGSEPHHTEALTQALPASAHPAPIPSRFLRGQRADLIEVLPKFSNSVAPVLFHLPSRTIDRVLDNVPPIYIAPAYVENGRSCFGLDAPTVSNQLPRWTHHEDTDKSRKIAMRLSHLVIRTCHGIHSRHIPDVIEVNGRLCERGLVAPELANEVLRQILPICLERKSLNKSDILKIVSGVRRIPVSKENAILFPMISNFASWFLERNAINKQRRLSQKLHEQRLADAIGTHSPTPAIKASIS